MIVQEALGALAQYGQPGQSLWCLLPRPPAQTWEFGWLVREASARIRAWPPVVEMEIRSMVAREVVGGKAVAVIPMLLRVGPLRPEALFETWVNPCAEGGREALEALTWQPILSVHFVGDSGQVERSKGIIVDASLRAFAGIALRELDRRPAWSMAAYDGAQAIVRGVYPSVLALWQAMRLPAGRREGGRGAR